MSKKQLILDSVKDLVSDLMFYDRKEDEDLSVKDIEESFKSGEVTISEVVEIFRIQLTNEIDLGG